MQSNTAVKFLPIYTDEKKVEVSLEQDQAVIKLSTWVEDLGWCAQKTMSLDAEMLDDLHRVIASARYRLNKKTVEEAENQNTAKVLAFPSFS
jgi:predicted DCC family thiol-disulfide oxidoreductase YuxK